jgi:hypothetical protein
LGNDRPLGVIPRPRYARCGTIPGEGGEGGRRGRGEGERGLSKGGGRGIRGNSAVWATVEAASFPVGPIRKNNVPRNRVQDSTVREQCKFTSQRACSSRPQTQTPAQT